MEDIFSWRLIVAIPELNGNGPKTGSAYYGGCAYKPQWNYGDDLTAIIRNCHVHPPLSRLDLDKYDLGFSNATNDTLSRAAAVGKP